MKKLGIIHNKIKSSWTSCQSITQNLAQAYQLAFPGYAIEFFHLDEHLGRYGEHLMAERLAAYRPHLLTFIDNWPHPEGVITSLSALLPPEQYPRVAFHVFGDFPIFSNSWVAIQEALTRMDCRFICASERQKKLIESFVELSPHGLSQIPFAVDTRHYYFSPSLRQEGRLGQPGPIHAQDFLFVYAGRLSAQKNIQTLIRTFASLLVKTQMNAHLWLAGTVDDMGAPYLGKKPPNGIYSYSLRTLIEEVIPPSLRHRIQFLGNLNADALLRLYNAADCFMSLGTHNDEDFGMAPAEAALSGCSLILSDWGGFASFKTYLPDGTVHLVPTSIEKDRVSPNPSLALKAMIQSVLHPPSQEVRQQIAQAAQDRFSCPAVAQALTQVLTQSEPAYFKGFSPLFLRVAQSFRLVPDAPFSSHHAFSDLYRKVYQVYVQSSL